jgi:hypothetical protein
MVDEYDEDWGRLWWVRIDGRASIHERDEAWSRAREVLATKYHQYAERPPQGRALVIEVTEVTSWASTP